MNRKDWNILLIDDDEEEYLITRAALNEVSGGSVKLDWVSNYSDGIAAVSRTRPDAVLVDYHLRDQDGLDLIREARQAGFEVPYILLTGAGSYDLDLAAMQAGAADYLSKEEVTPRQLERTLRYAIERQRLLEENRQQKILFQTVFEVNPDGLAVFTGHDLVFQVANPAYRRLTPRPEIDPTGKTVEEIWSTAEGFTALKFVHQVLESGQPLVQDHVEYTYPDNSRHSLAFQLLPYNWQGHPAVLMVVWEITALEEARAQAEHAAGEAERRASEAEEGRRILEAIMEYLPEGLTIAEGPEGKMRLFSKHGLRLLAHSESDVIDTTLEEYQHMWNIDRADKDEPFQSQEFPLARAVREGKVIENEEISMQAADGRRLILSCNAAPIRGAEGKITGGLISWRDISESKRLQEALRESETKFRAIFEANIVPLAMWHIDGSILDANDAFLGLVQFSHQELSDGTLRWADLTPQEFQAKDERALQEMISGRPATPYEKEYQLRDGSRVPVLIGGAMLAGSQDRGWAFAIDLSERKQAEAALARANTALLRSNRRMTEVLSSITDAYISFDSEWRCTAVNPVAEALVFRGRSASELLGKVIWDEYPDMLEQQVYQEFQRASQENRPVHVEAFSASGNRWFEVHGYPRDGALEVYMRDIDDRKRYEQRLAYHALLLENVHDAILATDENLCLTAWNRAAEELYGWKAEEVLGKNLGDVIRSEINHSIFQEAMRLLQEQGFYRLEITQFTRDGRRIVIEGSTIALQDEQGRVTGFISANRDVTARIRANQERDQLLRQLEQQQAHLSAIIQNAPVGIVVADNEARILLANTAGERQIARPIPYGQQYNSFLELNLCYPDGTPYEPRNLPLTRSALDGESFENLEMLVIWPDGQRRDWLVNASPILSKAGQLVGAIAIFQDVTDQRRAAEQLQRNAAKLEIQRYLTRFREMERLNIAHDLHDGPLQEMIGITFKLSEAMSLNPDGEVGSLLSDTQNEMHALIKDMRTFCNELRPPALTPFGLERAIRSHNEKFRASHPHLHMQLELVHDGQQLPDAIRVVLFQVYRESLNNIIKHAQATRVDVRFFIQDGEAVLEVQDNGRGFQTPHHWVEFARQGHLGLVGMQERAEAVGGRVRLVTEPGKGTSLQVVIPYQNQPELVSGESLN